MQLRLNISHIYLFCTLFIAAAIVALAYEIWLVLAIPLIIPFVYTFLVHPKYLIYVIAFATPLSVQLSRAGNNLSLSLPTEPIIILLMLGFGLKLVIGDKISFKLLKLGLVVLILSDVFWLGVTSIFSSMPLISLKFLLSKIWYISVCFFLFSHAFKQEKVVKTFLWCLSIATVLLAVYTLYNHSLGSFSRSYAYTAMRPFLPDHGMYAAALSFVVPVLFVFAVYGNELGFHATVRLFALGLFLFLCVAVALSFTRASWLSLLVAFAVYAALLMRVRLKYLLFLAFVAGSVLYVNFDDIFTDLTRNKSESDDNIEEHLQSVSNVSSDPSNMERLNRWSCAIRMYEDRPNIGFGPGTYTFQYGIYQVPHEMTIISTNAGTLGNVHSEYFRPLVESGWPGFVIFLMIVVSSLNLGFKQFRELSGARKYLSLAALLGLVTYFTHGLLNNYSEFDKIAVPMYGFMAILVAHQVILKGKLNNSTSETRET